MSGFWLIVDASYTPAEYAELVSRCKQLVRLAEWSPFLRGETTARPRS